MRDYLKLHLVILLWGFTAVLGNLIDISPTQLVLIRSLLATLLLVALLRRRAMIPGRLAVALIANGMLLGLHWVLFFLAVKIASVSICMIGVATVSFWTALLEPMLNRKVRLQRVNVVLGLVVIAAVYLIYRSETEFHLGLIVAVLAAVLACLFSIFNGRLAGSTGETVIVMYEMAGAAILCVVGLAIAPLLGIELASDRMLPTPVEWIYLAILVLVCTIFAYWVYVELLRRMSVFTINFANNMEPIYGITFGAIFFGDLQHVGTAFYAGAVLIFAAVLVQPWLAKRFP
ncbi:DMT family transporter [Stieleria sp. TO1_6]|nr:DMT family transporter [Stieleria tagensis]